MSRKRDKIWTAIIATKQWFAKLFTSEADALVDDFKNNPPPNIGTQPFSGDIHDKGDWISKLISCKEAKRFSIIPFSVKRVWIQFI